MKNEIYSFQNFTGCSFKTVPASEFNNTEIVGSCFYQEWKAGDTSIVKDIFPDGMTGVTFVRCNLDNVFVPEGNTAVGCSNRIIKAEEDGTAYILDGDGNKIEPVCPPEPEPCLCPLCEQPADDIVTMAIEKNSVSLGIQVGKVTGIGK